MRKKTKESNRYPPQVYSGISDDPDSWGMCCSEEMARRCAEQHWDAQKPSTLADIALTTFVIFCTIGVTSIVALVLLGLVMSVMDAFVQVIPIAGAKALYYAGGLLLLVGFVPFASGQWNVLRERLKYRYDMFDWVSIPVMVITYVAVIVIVTPAAIHYFVG